MASPGHPFHGKVALITGAGKGLGREIALHLAQKGVSVACCSRSRADLDTLARQVESTGGQILCQPLDVRDTEALTAFVAQTEARFTRLDFLIVNAGVDLQNAKVEDSDPDLWQETVDVNLLGAYKTVKSAIPLLKKKGGGHILVIGSGLGHRGMSNKSAYSVSKAGLWMLTRVLAEELVTNHILVNEVIPGPVKTHIGRDIPPQSGLVTAAFTQEWNKEPRDVLPLVEFLLSQPPTGPTGQSFSLARRDL